jgi:hypothetical protein
MFAYQGNGYTFIAALFEILQVAFKRASLKFVCTVFQTKMASEILNKHVPILKAETAIQPTEVSKPE